MFLRELLECCCAGARDRLRQLEVLVVLALAEILRTEKLLGAEDLRALFRGAFGKLQRLFEIGLWIGRTGSLKQAEPHDRRPGLHLGFTMAVDRAVRSSNCVLPLASSVASRILCPNSSRII